ncbi:MAG: glycerol-3-phosphate responsive antiterminator [Chloroflexia bacterium]
MTERAHIQSRLSRNRIVPAVRDLTRLRRALSAGPSVVIVFSPSIDMVVEMAGQAQQAGVLLLVHADMMEGIASDAAGLRFLARSGVGGVATTRAQTMTMAHQAGLVVTFRAFLIDSAALETVARIVERNHPDVVEALPAPVLSHLPSHYIDDLGVPILAGGLVRTKADVDAAIAAGATAISTSTEALWGASRLPVSTG